MSAAVTDTHEHEHHGPNLQAYLVVGGALAGFTTVSFIANQMAQAMWITAMTSFAIILGVAFVKAGLVGLYFMHLKYDWRKVAFLIFPALILATMFVFVLMPDLVLVWRQ